MNRYNGENIVNLPPPQPLEILRVLYLNKYESSSPEHALCQSFLWKVYDNDANDSGQFLIRKAHLTIRIRRAKKDNEKRRIDIS